MASATALQRDTTDGRAAAPRLGPRLRARRRKLQLTLKAVAERAGVSVGYLSQVETDKAVPTLGTLAQVARALDVGLDYFVTTPKPADALSRAEGRERFSLPGSPVVYESLGADYPGSELSSYILHVPPGYASETVVHEGEEIIVILEGEIEQRLGDAVMAMRPGDALHYSGATPHAWANRTSAPARVLWTGTLSVLMRVGKARPAKEKK
ncbi:helix-turn-helix domain-containing protein [Oceaniglobus trochenteri]|uniref:helix-turn-helix domain-containing protein n=1 Tax=Oceaniglobus trochenteri TaxID=2763260 RepID=UPI001CFFFAB2|nr:XRE family transcriptional regulator [Oceaniglobus trochenteri]